MAALEKDAELDRRIAALRRKNEALVRRYQEIEEDRRQAEREGGAVTAASARVTRRDSDRDRDRDSPGDKRSPKDKQLPPTPKIWGKPQKLGGGWANPGGGRARRGRGGKGGESDRKSQEWEQRRLQNIEQMNEEMERIAEYERSRRDGVPEKNPVRNFLDDPRRCGPEPGGSAGGSPRRHGRNWGGPDFPRGPRRGMARPGSQPPLDPTLWMTGRQRAEYQRWKREREKIDRERLERHRDPAGAWRREWDAQKPEGMFSGVPEGGGEPSLAAPPPPTLGEFLPLPHPARRRKSRGRGRRTYSCHDDRWDAQPEPSQDPQGGQLAENIPEKIPENIPEQSAESPAGIPSSSQFSPVQTSNSQEDEDQWEDVSDEEEEEPGELPRVSPPAPPPPAGELPALSPPPPESSGTSSDAPGVEISDFQRVRFRRPADPPQV